MFDRDLTTWYRELFFPQRMANPFVVQSQATVERIAIPQCDARDPACAARQAKARRRWQRVRPS